MLRTCSLWPTYAVNMVEVRIHGRGGQGVVTAADMVAMAAFHEGRHAQAFPSFGSERTGAPVVAYARIRDAAIRTREPVLHPDLIIVQDPTLLPILDVFAGLAADGYALVNSLKSLGELGVDGVAEAYPPGHVITMPATDIAREYTGRTVPNAVLLGGMAALAHPFKLESVNRAIRERFPGTVGEMNVAAAEAAYRYVGEKTGSTNTKEVRLNAATN